MKTDLLDLLDYRRRVADMYRRVREQSTDSADAHAHFRRERDELFLRVATIRNGSARWLRP